MSIRSEHSVSLEEIRSERCGNLPDVVATEDPSAEPAVEPPCKDCQRVRPTSDGKKWWCSRHAEHHARAHSYSYRDEWPFELHDSDVIPTGVDVA